MKFSFEQNRFKKVLIKFLTLWTNTYRVVMEPMCVFQRKSNDQTDGAAMSLGNKKGVRVTGKYVPPAELSSTARGPSIVHSPISTQTTSDAPAVISIVPLPQRSPEQADGPRAGGEDWRRGTPSQTRTLFGEMGVHRQTIEELKTILKDSPLLSIPEREEGKPGGPYTYLHESSSSSGGPDGREDNGNHHRTFRTFKPQFDASRREASSRDSTSIQPPPTMDSSSSFRSTGKTKRQLGVGTCGHSDSSSWGETADSHSGQNSTLSSI